MSDSSLVKIVIIEDEPLAAERLENLLKTYSRPLVMSYWADSVRSARDFLAQQTPDLLLMDIQLGDGLSFDIFQQLELRAPIIFTTAFDQYALQAFKLNSIDYLLKPIQKEQLHAALDRFFERRAPHVVAPAPPDAELLGMLAGMIRKEYKSRFLVKIGEKMITVPLSQIAYFFVEDRALLLRTRNGHTYVLNLTMDHLEMLLDPSLFFRINRACYLHIEAIQEVIPYPGNRLEVNPLARHQREPYIVSRELCTAFKDWLGQ
jgi:DNA-binding LytR/AlgR family response regulator